MGDGTTTVVILAGEFLKEAKPFIEDGVHPQNLIRSYRIAAHLVLFHSYAWLLLFYHFFRIVRWQIWPLLFLVTGNWMYMQAIEKVKDLATSIEGHSLEEKKSLLAKCAATTLSSKLIGGEKDFFAQMVVDAVLAVGIDDRLSMIGIKKVIVSIGWVMDNFD